MDHDHIMLGIISGVHGLHGHVHIKTFTAVPGNITSYGPLFLKDGRTLTVTNIKGVKEDSVIATLQEVTTRTEAECLKGQSLFIGRNQLPATDDNEYYHNDLINSAVYDEHQDHIGTVVAIHNYGANDILEIKKLDGDFCMVPFIDDALRSIDIQEKSIVVLKTFIA